MNFSDFENLVKTRQSCRDFNDKPLEKEIVDKIVKTARLAPSACNSQPWKLYCVTDNEKAEEVRNALTDAGKNTFLKNAKAFIAVAEKIMPLKEDVLRRFSPNHFVKYDVGEIIAYVTLAAESLGVKSCIIGWINTENLAAALGLAPDEQCNIVIALGYSDIPVREKVRLKEEQVIKYL